MIGTQHQLNINKPSSTRTPNRELRQRRTQDRLPLGRQQISLLDLTTISSKLALQFGKPKLDCKTKLQLEIKKNSANQLITTKSRTTKPRIQPTKWTPNITINYSRERGCVFDNKGNDGKRGTGMGFRWRTRKEEQSQVWWIWIITKTKEVSDSMLWI